MAFSLLKMSGGVLVWVSVWGEVPAHPGSPGQRAVKRVVVVCNYRQHYSEAAFEVFAPKGRYVALMGVQQWPWTEGPLLYGTPARQVSPPSVQR